MDKKKLIKRLFNLRNLIIFSVSMFIGAIIIILFCVFRQEFNLLNANDGSFVACAILIAFGCLHITLNMGTFDVVAVGFANLFSVFKKNGSKKYDGVYEYQLVKEEKRNSTRFYFFPILIAGLIYLLLAFILFTLYKNSLL